jgi:hypothetical protein
MYLIIRECTLTAQKLHKSAQIIIYVHVRVYSLSRVQPPETNGIINISL